MRLITKSISVLLLSLWIVAGFASSRVIHVETISRHCDRTPWVEEIIPNDPVDWPTELGLEFGQLTPRGMNQCFQLGKSIRERYFDEGSELQIHNITRNFQSLEHKISSTSVHRTIISAWAVSMGLFPQTGPVLLGGEPALPGKIDPVPTHTPDHQNDMLLYATWNCPKIYSNIAQRAKEPEVVALQNKYGKFMKECADAAGIKWTVDISTFPMFFDLVNVQRDNGKLHIQFLLDNFEKIKELSDIALFAIYTRGTFGTIAGGTIVNEVLKGMQDFVAKKENPELLLSKIEDEPLDALTFLSPMAQEQKLKTAHKPHYKYMHWSAHDDTLISILHALRLIDDYPENAKNPLYGACIAFELHENEKAAKGEERYFVRIVYKKGYDQPFIAYPLKSLGKSVHGCAADCPLSRFRTVATEDAIPADWCSECNNEYAAACIPGPLNTARTLLSAEKAQVQTLQQQNSSLSFYTLIAIIFTVIVIILFLVALLLLAIIVISSFGVGGYFIFTRFVQTKKNSSPVFEASATPERASSYGGMDDDNAV